MQASLPLSHQIWDMKYRFKQPDGSAVDRSIEDTWRRVAGALAEAEDEGTEILGHVKTEDEALEHIVAVVQMYREQGHYLERIYKWAKRIGYDEVRRQIMDDPEKRKAYYDRFVHSQKFAQVDPWDERVSGKDKHEFQPMATLSLEAAE